MHLSFLMDRREHWDSAYKTKSDEQLSWFQAQPLLSLSLFDSLQPLPNRVIDIGGGQSALPVELLHRGVPAITVLDISDAALQRAKARASHDADRITWVCADVLDFQKVDAFDLWHDRAAFHFLTDPNDRKRYATVAASAVVRGGHMIIATFSLTGPDKCSGLSVSRYDAPSLAAEFSPAFSFVASAPESHTTPWGRNQDFIYVVMRRT